MSVLITGQQWVPLGYFQYYYETPIREAFAAGKNFRLGAAESGVDLFAQHLLKHLCIASKDEKSFQRVTIYNKDLKDGRIDKRFTLVNGYASYPDRDVQMAISASDRIVCLAQWGGGVSGTLLPLLVMQIFKDHEAEEEDDVMTPQEAFARGDKTLGMIRGASETWNADWLESEIIPLYKRLYPAKPTDWMSVMEEVD